MNRILLQCFGHACGGALVVLLLCLLPWMGFAQGKAVNMDAVLSIKLENSSVESVFTTIAKKSGYLMSYNPKDIRVLPHVSGDYKEITIGRLIELCIANSPFKCTVENNTITIRKPAPTQSQINRLTVSGTITDTNKVPLVGASVMLKGSYNLGVSADAEGKYSFSFPVGAGDVNHLVFSFIGYDTKEVTVTQSMSSMNVSLNEAGTKINEVVVNGVFTRNKATFTGSATTIKGEDLIAVSNTSLLTAIAALTPGMIIPQNNAMGSNPNAIPEILIRGANSIATSAEQKAYNNPLIILDGAEISIEELYDLDMYDIERVDVLKDAQATIVYGDRAANGVIVIERQRVTDSKVRLSYNFIPEFSIPDLSSLNLANAEQKLELERLAKLYATNDGSMDQAYAYKLQNVRRGINTNWISTPLRTPVSHTHSVQMSGRGQSVDYRASLKFSDKYGVMKGDNRRNYAMNFSIGYHAAERLTVRYSANYSLTNTMDSPYGDFSDYTKLNPYEPVFDQNGDYVKAYYFDPFNKTNSQNLFQVNPLYNATLSSFSKSRAQSLRNTLDAKWYLTRQLFVTGQFNVDIRDSQRDKYVSPENAQYLNVTNPIDRGAYQMGRGDGFGYDGKVVVNYSKTLGSQGTGFAISVGSDIEHARTNTTLVNAKGFLKDGLGDIKYALAYDPNNLPSGIEQISARAGFFANANLYWKNRYFADISYRTSGYSAYGSNNRFAPMWSFGLGWNIHKENFLNQTKWLDVLRLTWTWGYSGSTTGNPYQAMTTYRYNNNYLYYTGVGAVPITMGNPDLKWQRTLKNNIGIDATLFKERLNVTLDYFNNVTKDQLMEIPLPASTGTVLTMVNFGENQNQGFDFSVAGKIIQNQNWSWTMVFNGTHVKDKIKKISNTLSNTSYQLDASSPLKLRFREGGSQYDVYAVRSAGIDPATGQEIFFKLNGERTFKYDPADEVVVGNTNPTLQGSWLNTLRYKGWSLNLTFSYTFGGDLYNRTLWGKVENIDPRYNVDARAFTDRWKNPGDLSRYLAIGSVQQNNSERFIEKHNELWLSNATIAYEFSSRILNRIGFKRLSVGVGMSDLARFSTVRFERGTSYPYCRTVNLTLRPTF